MFRVQIEKAMAFCKKFATKWRRKKLIKTSSFFQLLAKISLHIYYNEFRRNYATMVLIYFWIFHLAFFWFSLQSEPSCWACTLSHAILCIYEENKTKQGRGGKRWDLWYFFCFLFPIISFTHDNINNLLYFCFLLFASKKLQML
jgi:hypothetical protein